MSVRVSVDGPWVITKGPGKSNLSSVELVPVHEARGERRVQITFRQSSQSGRRAAPELNVAPGREIVVEIGGGEIEDAVRLLWADPEWRERLVSQLLFHPDGRRVLKGLLDGFEQLRT
jgi:hypothetical protein